MLCNSNNSEATFGLMFKQKIWRCNLSWDHLKATPENLKFDFMVAGGGLRKSMITKFNIWQHIVSVHSQSADQPFQGICHHIESTCFSDVADEPPSHTHTHTQCKNRQNGTSHQRTSPMGPHLPSLPICTLEVVVSWILSLQNSGTPKASLNLLKYDFHFPTKV